MILARTVMLLSAIFRICPFLIIAIGLYPAKAEPWQDQQFDTPTVLFHNIVRVSLLPQP
jgi:K+-transporting ATPase A subunit